MVFVLNVGFFGLFWIYVLLGLRRAPEFVRRAAWIVPFYVVMLLFIGFWNEIRYWLMLYPILISLGLAVMYQANEVPPPGKVSLR